LHLGEGAVLRGAGTAPDGSGRSCGWLDSALLANNAVAVAMLLVFLLLLLCEVVSAGKNPVDELEWHSPAECEECTRTQDGSKERA